MPRAFVYCLLLKSASASTARWPKREMHKKREKKINLNFIRVLYSVVVKKIYVTNITAMNLYLKKCGKTLFIYNILPHFKNKSVTKDSLR